MRSVGNYEIVFVSRDSINSTPMNGVLDRRFKSAFQNADSALAK